MALELEALVFTVDSKPLKDAYDRVEELTTALQKLNETSKNSSAANLVNAEKELARAKRELAKVVESQEKAEARLEETRRKNAQAAEDAANKEVQAKNKSTKATEDNTKATKDNTTILERQKDILDFQAQGFSKGQSGILAYAKAAKIAAGDMQELMQVLQQQRSLMGGDPFDKSQSGLVSLGNQLRALTEATIQYNVASGLTREQTRELSRDKERLALLMQREGKTVQEITAAQDAYNRKYVEAAREVNNLANAEKNRERAQRDQLNAMRAVEAAEERMANTVKHLDDFQNGSVKTNERAALAIGSYERNLRLAGITGEEAAKKLRIYTDQQQKLSDAEAKRAKEHLARGMTTQLGDIGISLYAGQNPLTVMLQQGDQIRDMIARSRVSAEEMKTVMAAAFSQMAGSFKMVGTAVTAFAGSAVEGLGAFIMKTSLAAKAVNMMNEGIDKTFTGKFAERLKDAVSGIGPLIGFLTTTIAAFATVSLVAAVQVAKASDEMSVSLARFGAIQGLSIESATQKSIEFSDVTRTTMTTAMKAITDFSKSGIRDMSVYDDTVQTALIAQKTLGITTEQYATSIKDVYDKPLESLTKLAIETGKVNVQDLERVRLLQEEGKFVEAGTEATKLYNAAIRDVSIKAEAGLSPIAHLWKNIKQAASDAWDSIQKVGESDFWKWINGLLNAIVFSIKSSINGLGAIGQIISAVLDRDFGRIGIYITELGTKQEKAYQEMLDANDKFSVQWAANSSARGDADAAAAAKFLEKYNKVLEKFRTKAEKPKASQYSSEVQFIADSIKELEKDAGQSLTSIDKKLAEAYFGKEFASAHKAKTEAQKEQEKLDKEAQRDLQSLTNLYEKAEGRIKHLTEAEIELNKIKSKDDYKKYNETMKLRIEAEAELAGFALKRKANSELAMKIDKEWLEINKQLQGQAAEVTARTDAANNELKILFLTGKEKERVTREIELQNKYLQDQIKYEKEKLEIEKRFVATALLIQKEVDEKGISPEDANARRLQNIQEYLNSMASADDTLARNRLASQLEVNKKVVEDWSKEFNRITDGLTDVLVTALTEGGAAGGKKFREMIQAELKKPFVAVLNAFVRNASMQAAQAVGIVPSGVSSAYNAMGMVSTGNSAYNLYSGATIDTVGNVVGKLAGGESYLANTGAYAQGFSNGLTNAPSMSAQYLEASKTLTASGELEAAKVYSDASTAAQAGEQAGSTTGTAMTYAAYAYALYALSKGDYKTAGGTAGAAAGAQIGSNIMPGWGTAIGAVIGYIAGTALGSSLMGGGKKTEGWATGVVTASGVDVGTLPSGAVGLDANYSRNQASSSEVYDAIRTYQDGIANIISSTAKGLNGVAEGIGISLGFNTDPKGTAQDNITGAVYDKQGKLVYSNVYNADKGTFKEELGKESQRIIVAALKQIDLADWADSVLASVDPLKATAEELAAALTNLTSMKTLVGIFEGLGLKADNLSMNFVNLFGGFEGATKAVNDYYEAYYTEEEKRARIVKNITTTLVNAGAQLTEEQVGNATKEEFRKVYEAVVSAQGAGSALATAMLSVAGTFATVAKAAESSKVSLSDWANAVAGMSQDQKTTAIDAAKTAYDNLVTAVEADKAKLKADYDKAVTDFKNTQANTLSDFDTRINASKDLLTSVTSVVSKLKSALESVVDDSYSARKARFQGAVSSLGNMAKANDFLNPNLDNVLSLVQGDNKDFFSSYFEYARNQALVRNDISSLGAAAGTQETTLKDVVKTLETQKTEYKDASDAQLVAMQESFDNNNKFYDSVLKYYKDQLDELSGIRAYLGSFDMAVQAMINTLNSSKSTIEYANKNSAVANLKDANANILSGTAISDSTLKNLNEAKATDVLNTPTNTYVSSLGAGASLSGDTKFVTKTGQSMTVLEAANTLISAMQNNSPTDVVNAAKYYGLSKQAALDLYNYGMQARGQQGSTMGQFDMWLQAAGIPAFASGGSYQGGLALAGENGPELINFSQPGQIYNASQTSNILGGVASKEDLEVLVSKLIEEVSMLRYESRATAINTAKLSKQFDRATGTDDALKVVVQV